MWKLKKERKKVSLKVSQKNLQLSPMQYFWCRLPNKVVKVEINLHFFWLLYIYFKLSFILPGTSNRTVAATQMNATSSRAHTVVTVTFDQISKNESGQETKKSSTINLVDLAGKT